MTAESLSAGAIRAHLEGITIARRVVFYHTVASTMEAARREIEDGTPSGTLVVAEEQSGGQGRLGREWLSPAGNVYLSLILFPPDCIIPSLTMAAGLAVADAIAELCGIEARLKWPNDVLIGGKKVSGILAVSGTSRGVSYAVIGIGINVNLDVAAYPEISGTAASLSDATGRTVSRLNVIAAMLRHLESRLNQLQSGEFVWREWQERLDTIGRQVTVKSGGGVFEGVAEAVNASGSLMLRLSDRTLKEIPAGDVTLRG